MRHPGGKEADGGETFGAGQLLLGIKEFGVLLRQLGGARFDLLFQCPVKAANLFFAADQALLHRIEFLPEGGNFIVPLRGDILCRLAVGNATHPFFQRLDRPGQRRAEPGCHQRADQGDTGEDGGEGEVDAGTQQIKRRFGDADIQGADHRAFAVAQRLVSREMPGINHKGATDPAPAAADHLTHFVGHQTAEGALPLSVLHGGADADIIEKEGGVAVP